MPSVKYTQQLLMFHQPYLVVGAGFEVPSGIPRALKTPDGPLWLQREGEGTAFRIGPAPDMPGWFSVSVWWSVDGRLRWIPGDQVASGHNTVDLAAPAKGLFALQGSDSDIFAAMIQFETQSVSYSWAAYTQSGAERGEPPAVETVILAFE